MNNFVTYDEYCEDEYEEYCKEHYNNEMTNESSEALGAFIEQIRKDSFKHLNDELSSAKDTAEYYKQKYTEKTKELDEANKKLSDVKLASDKEKLGQLLIDRANNSNDLISFFNKMFTPTYDFVRIEQSYTSAHMVPYLLCKYYNNREEVKLILKLINTKNTAKVNNITNDIYLDRYNLDNIILPMDWDKETLIKQIIMANSFSFTNGDSENDYNYSKLYSSIRQYGDASGHTVPWKLVVQNKYITDEDVMSSIADRVNDAFCGAKKYGDLSVEMLLKYVLQQYSAEDLLKFTNMLDYKKSGFDSVVRKQIINTLLYMHTYEKMSMDEIITLLPYIGNYDLHYNLKLDEYTPEFIWAVLNDKNRKDTDLITYTLPKIKNFSAEDKLKIIEKLYS